MLKKFNMEYRNEEHEMDCEPYVLKLSAVLDNCYGFPQGITQLFDFLFLGGEDEAKNKQMLKKKGITHVINCASSYINTGHNFYGPNIKKYVEFEAEDEEGYNILEHYSEAHTAIEEARKTGGRALIHCIMGINRSAALATAYTMLHKQWGPVTASKYVKNARKSVLTNDSFRVQLVEFARAKNLLKHDSELVHS